ncbi:MAG: hypothetical protein RBT71_04175 [Flavobacteriales bacterium]|jgi:hypothetical protein|nr:hypothetical protein [Flavobacteriales bacterium]
MHRNLLPTLLLAVLLTACGGNTPSAPPLAEQAGAPESTTAADPATRKQAIDALLELDPGRVAVYAQVPGAQRPVIVEDGAFPEEVATTWNVLRDAAGHVVLVLEIPFSESGDWSIVLGHYFDAQGRTFAFERRAAFYNSLCTDGLAHETATRHYAPDGRETDALFSLKDEAGQDLDRAECDFPYDHPYTMHPTLAELVAATGLTL